MACAMVAVLLTSVFAAMHVAPLLLLILCLAELEAGLFRVTQAFATAVGQLC